MWVPMLITLVRHPAPDIEAGRCYGRLDIGLSAAGEADLPRLAARLRSGVVWTSPARRCRVLADLLSPTPVVDERLRELDFGAWEGVRWDEVPRGGLDAWAADLVGFAPPGGESGGALLGRTRAVCRDLLGQLDDVIVVAHGGPLKLLAAMLRGEPPDLLAPTPPLGSVTAIYVPEASTVRTAHSARTAAAPSTSPVKPPI